MNPEIYIVIILTALILHFLINSLAEILNLKALRPELPLEFAGLYDQQKYRESQEYTRAKTKFGFITAAFDLGLLLVFWFAGGFNALDLMVRAYGFGPVISGLIYIGLLLLLKTTISLPFSIYFTFVLEERFGFNRTTPWVFTTDLFKGIILATVLGGPLLAALLGLFERAGSLAWLYCWGVMTVFTLLIQFIAPAWIMPLFNKFVPLEEGELKSKIMGYAASVNFSLDNVFVMDGSKRSSKSNAFFTGFGKRKRIALFDTLIAHHTVAELVAVLAHEIGHYKEKHIVKGMLISIVHLGVILYLLSLFCYRQGLHDAFFMEQQSVYCGLIFFGLLLTPIEMVMALFMNIISRKNEYAADLFAVQTVRDKESLINALKKLSTHNLANLTPHPFYVLLNYSHPPLLRRIAAIKGHP